MFKANFMSPLKRGIATKEFTKKEGKWEITKGYQAGKRFTGFSIDCENLVDLFNFIYENQDTPIFWIHGEFVEGTDLSDMVRRKRANEDGEAITVIDRELQCFAIDVDGYQTDLKGRNAIDSFILRHLPEEFHTADYIYQFSSSYRLTSEDLKCHIFFWLENTLQLPVLKNWAKAYNKMKGWGNIIDDSIYTSTQPVYIQRRICIGGFDPIDEFTGIVKKSGRLLWIPKIPLEDSKGEVPISDKKTPYDLAQGVEKILTSENYHNELNSLALSLINKRVPPWTVKEMLKGAMNAAAKGIASDTEAARWTERYNDIGRSVDSAVEIVGNPTFEELMEWVNCSSEDEVRAGFAVRCMKLDPVDQANAVAAISQKLELGRNPVRKSINIAIQENNDLIREEAKKQQSEKRQASGITEIELLPTDTGSVAKKAARALASSTKDPQVFTMGSTLVSIGLGKPKSIRQMSRLDDLGADYPKMPVIQQYTRPFYSLAGRMEKDVVFVNRDGNDVECSARVLQMVGDSEHKHFSPLTGIVEHPFVNNNWEVVQKNGYNSRTGLYTVLHHKLKLQEMEPDVAYKYLKDTVFAEFPFASELDIAVATAALITAIQRPSITDDSGMPGFGIVSPVQSSGKTTLAQLISYAAFNRPAAASDWSADDEELGKYILAILQEGHSCVLFDNIRENSNIISSRLAKAMSTDIYGGRKLGENKTIEVPSSVLWMFTGNNIHFIGDFATRVYPININPNMEHPDQRYFSRENIGQWAMDNRKKIISAVISIVMGGKNTGDLKGATRFKLWDKFVRKPIFNASGIDVNEAVNSNRMSDPAGQGKANLLVELTNVFKYQKFSTKDVLKNAYGEFNSGTSPLGEAIDDLMGNKKAKNSMSLGRFLAGMDGAVFGDFQLNKHTSNYVTYSISRISGVDGV